MGLLLLLVYYLKCVFMVCYNNVVFGSVNGSRRIGQKIQGPLSAFI
jgi:hypothetical protein